MIYGFLKILTRLALRIYFRKVKIIGTENLPDEGPFLIVANHPSSFLDPISIAVVVKQKISFLAKASMFKNKFVASLLTGLNMVPIYRAQDDPTQLSKNQDVFKGCFKKLSHKGIILIFPEGTSEAERRLRKIKTGAARIALGAAKENDYDLNIKIVPVGLNYTKSSRFRSEQFLQIGKPLETKDYIEDYKNDEINAAKRLTQDIEENIKNLIIDIDKAEYEVLVEHIETLYKPELLKSGEFQGAADEIKISQSIYEGVKYYQQNDPVLFHEIKTKIDDYFLNLKAINMSDKAIEHGSKLGNVLFYIFRSVLVLVVGFPIWLFGYIHSFIPYKLPRFIALKITDSEAFYGALLMSIGTFSFIIFYSILIYLTWFIWHSPILTLCYGIALPITSFITIFYGRIARRFYYNWQFISRFFSKQKILVSLMSDRNTIIKELEEVKDNFLKTSI